MLRNYEQLSALHIWLLKRVERGLRIPESLDETTELVRQDPTGFPTRKFRYARKHNPFLYLFDHCTYVYPHLLPSTTG